jgi:hypothetical protein
MTMNGDGRTSTRKCSPAVAFAWTFVPKVRSSKIGETPDNILFIDGGPKPIS